ncbi:Major capsid protein Gp5 [uncultured Caudovirales phage]|uniref:Major capsid protein Gp5 n=1 Tax=uncultured Caudovirales phage TaxID=2100421 RepID=A0A6J5NDW3_9CAUD|nr:Major capsid protein Gp5 [uncultured Caudovirales phage]CAB4157319.1 Major capsid protein Gp5 [uncultured Caudovirales phage]CAB5225485.1 Major capsid protein Gp5 [uncultured Caudovirales phage]
MANVFRETQYVLDDVFVRFWNSLSFARTANRNLEGDFKNLRFATGQTLDYRLEERYLAGEGATATAEARVQIIRPLSITKQFRTMIEYTGFNLTFDRARDEPYLEMANAPRAKRLANLVEKFIASEFQTKTYQAVGTPGVPVDFNTILSADAYMTELAIPEDGKRFSGIGPRIAANLSNDLYNTFNNTVNTGALIDGFVGHLSGFDFFKTNFLSRQIAGAGQAGGSPPAGFKLGGTVTNGPIVSGNTISVTGLVPSVVAFNIGDIIEVDDAAGVFMVNPLTYDALEQRAQFVVTATVVATGGGTADIPVNPTIVIDGARQNISAAIPNGAQILLRDSHNVSLAYHTQAVVFAAPPIKELRGGVEAVTRYSDLYKLAMTYSLGADIRNYEQLDRIDVICGVAINPEFAVRICS